jgi:hypothetical protein
MRDFALRFTISMDAPTGEALRDSLTMLAQFIETLATDPAARAAFLKQRRAVALFGTSETAARGLVDPAGDVASVARVAAETGADDMLTASIDPMPWAAARASGLEDAERALEAAIAGRRKVADSDLN